MGVGTILLMLLLLLMGLFAAAVYLSFRKSGLPIDKND